MTARDSAGFSSANLGRIKMESVTRHDRVAPRSCLSDANVPCLRDIGAARPITYFVIYDHIFCDLRSNRCHVLRCLCDNANHSIEIDLALHITNAGNCGERIGSARPLPRANCEAAARRPAALRFLRAHTKRWAGQNREAGGRRTLSNEPSCAKSDPAGSESMSCHARASSAGGRTRHEAVSRPRR